MRRVVDLGVKQLVELTGDTWSLELRCGIDLPAGRGLRPEHTRDVVWSL